MSAPCTINEHEDFYEVTDREGASVLVADKDQKALRFLLDAVDALNSKPEAA